MQPTKHNCLSLLKFMEDGSPVESPKRFVVTQVYFLPTGKAEASLYFYIRMYAKAKDAQNKSTTHDHPEVETAEIRTCARWRPG